MGHVLTKMNSNTFSRHAFAFFRLANGINSHFHFSLLVKSTELAFFIINIMSNHLYVLRVEKAVEFVKAKYSTISSKIVLINATKSTLTGMRTKKKK